MSSSASLLLPLCVTFLVLLGCSGGGPAGEMTAEQKAKQAEIESALRAAGNDSEVRFLGGPTQVGDRKGNPGPASEASAANVCGDDCQVAYEGCNSCGEQNCNVLCYCDSGDWSYCDYDCC